MDEHVCPEGITAIRAGGGLAFFADAGLAPASLSLAELADAAAGLISRVVGQAIPVLYARQAHTVLSFVYGAEGPLAPGPHLVGVCDALITAETGVALLVRTADCLPVALAGSGVAAMVHAGWRGLAGDILGATVRRLYLELGVEPADLQGVIGVGVGPCHYRVGSDVGEALARLDAGSSSWRCDDRVDLGEFARGRLVALGLEDTAVSRLPGCTACSPRHHSHRRDGAGAGRQWSAVLRPGA